MGGTGQSRGSGQKQKATLGLSIPQDSQPEGCASRFVTCNELQDLQ